MANGRPYFSLVKERYSDSTIEEVERSLQHRLEDAENMYIDEDSKYKEMLTRKKKMEIERAKNQLALYNKDKETYATLYSIQDLVSSEVVAKDEKKDTRTAEVSAVKEDEAGNLSVKISMLHPIGASITVVDGKVQFSPENMTPEKMAEMIDFLQRHGLVVDTDSLKLENADERTQEAFEGAKEIFEERAQEGIENLYTRTAHSGKYEDPYLAEEQAEIEKWFEENGVDDREVGQVSQIDDPDLVDELSKEDDGKKRETGETRGAEAKEDPETGGEAEEEKGEEKKGGEKAPKKPAKKKMTAQEQLKEFDASIEGWMNKNKRKNYSWYDGTCWNGGWRTFTCYTSESNDPLRKSITVDPKTKEVKCNYEFKIYTRIGPNGKVEIAYSLPPGKKLTDDQAYLLASAFKDAGIKYVEYAGMPDDDEAIMRGALAKRALIPVGHKINAERFNKMADVAKGKLGDNSAELYKYKHDLAKQMERILIKKGIKWWEEENKNNPDCRCIRWAIGAYKLHPFRDLWEDFGLRGEYEKWVNAATGRKSDLKEKIDPDNGAHYAIGATKAVYSLYSMFDEATTKDFTLKDLLEGKSSHLSPAEINALRKGLTEKDTMDTEVRNLSPTAMKAIYNEMVRTQTKVAEKELSKTYMRKIKNKNNDDIETSAVKECLNNAVTIIKEINGQLEDAQLPKIYLTGIPTPYYQFTEAKEQAKREGLIGEEEKGGSSRSSGGNRHGGGSRSSSGNGGGSYRGKPGGRS